ncbi:sporulation integral membrane protein YtvI [Bacillus kwashiorkori]|uniref:sporulation integral membrane protein YtvI n=1 Tax=Bacillus kwashiorkori TaxID=1522318 RepID=UPI000784EF97|nr:sporulation integral membrane protein YtvI [Bacillus kwashiorkori]
MNTILLQRFLRLLSIVLGFVAALVSFYFLSSLLYPFIIAWFIAFLMNPLVNFLQVKGKMPRALSVLIVLIFIFGIIASLLTLLVYELFSGAEYLAKTIPGHIETFITYIEQWITGTVIPFFNQITNMFNNLQEGQQDTIINNLQQIGTDFAAYIATLLQTIVTKLPAIFSWFPNAATATLFTILAAFFISKDWYRLKTLVGHFIPQKAKESGISIYYDLRKALFGFIRAQLTLISITAVIVLIGLLILRVNYAIALAFIIGFIDLLPYLGTGFVFVPWIIYEFITSNYSLAIGLTVLYVIVLVQRQLMEPKIVSTNIGVSPLATLISIFVGLKLLGFAGLIIGPITLVIISALYKGKVFHNIWYFIKG